MNAPASQVTSHIKFEPPDTLHVVYRGVIDGAAVRSVREQGRVFVVGLEYYLLIFDVTAMQTMTGDGRIAMAVRAAKDVPPLSAIAVVGASFHLRAIMTMIAKAWHLLHGPFERPVQFFDSTDQARLWLSERRRMLVRRSA